MKPAKLCLAMFAFAQFLGPLMAQNKTKAPPPLGKLIDVGDHKLHINCTGKGTPTVVIENGFQEYSFDWVLVQNEVSKFTRICTYDRAGYAWSEPGPKPRTYPQINLELHDALATLHERGPFVLVGHSFGGSVVRNYALLYQKDVAGMVLAETVADDQRIPIGNKATLLRDFAQGKTIPQPHKMMEDSDKPTLPLAGDIPPTQSIEPPFDRLPPDIQKLHLWADSSHAMEDAANSESMWSAEYFALWHAKSQVNVLGSMPLIVLTRAQGGYGDDLDIPAAQVEAERKKSQADLAQLSSVGKQRIVDAGHNLQVEAPAAVVEAIREVVDSVRKKVQRKM